MQSAQQSAHPNSRRCLVIRAFAPAVSGHGGQRRSWQIERHLEGMGYVCESLIMPPTTRSQRLRSLATVGWRLLGHFRRLGFSLRGLPQLAAGFDALSGADPRRYDRIMVEATSQPGVAAWVAWHGLCAEAYPHNVETLVHPAVGVPPDPARLGWRLADEIAALRLMAAVHCICAEDSWFFTQFGIKADVFPYVPPPLAATGPVGGDRAHRILILGSATNPPTAHGLRQVLRQAPRLRGLLYTVVGMGTERFAAEFRRDDVEFLGEVSEARLLELQAESRLALCYQEYGTGVLTRIADLLARGMTVWANPHAARGYGPRSNFHVFTDWSELTRALGTTEKV